uniref:Fibronectin type-III domain-containing protein n=1 Tax=Salarias fasciatus TaxID=181472 RepID=A0A672GQA5_SALFA
MISSWVPVIVMLGIFVNGARSENVTRPCATLQTSSSVVPIGSPVTATCVISEDCPLAVGQAVHTEWRLGDRLVPSSPVANTSGRVSEAVIPSFNHSRAFLTCSIQGSPPQVVAGVEIRAGYPPEAPQNLSCQTNLTTPKRLTCSWDAGQRETHLLTKYTLHTQIRYSKKNYTYQMPPGVCSFSIPRLDFGLFSEMIIYVRAVNDLGEATSSPITLEPISAAKFDPPEIVKIEVPRKYGCLTLRWCLSRHQAWMSNQRMNIEVRLKTADSNEWSEIPVNNIKPSRPVDQCRLLHWTRYFAQIRVRFQQSPWSEWSSSQSGVTLESAPTGHLDSWMKVSQDDVTKQLNIHLFWKASKQFRANSQSVSYMVSALKEGKGKVCSTRENNCTFQLPRRAKKVYLTAVNSVGKSSPTEVRILHHKDREAVSHLKAVPRDNSSFLVEWEGAVTPDLVDYVAEWRPLLETGLSHIRFDTAEKNRSSLVLTGSFEPDKPYGISVYPRFKDGIGLPQTVNAYLRQKAPSMVPEMKIKKTWKSQVELTWGEIPLAERNGIIQSYKIFYWNEKGPINIVNVDPAERKVVLQNLKPLSRYEVFMMVSTMSLIAIFMILTGIGVTLSLLVIFVFLKCLSKHKRLKRRLWPSVPDPANSSIKRWTSESTQDIRSLNVGQQEPNLVYLSHLSFLDLPMKLSKEEDLWSNNAEDTSDLGESICGSPFIPGYSGSNSDSVPYATVIFSGPCSSPSPKKPHVYLRSESTQPLLEREESFSPKCYQNMVTDEVSREQCFFGPSHNCGPGEETGPDILWDDFPFLRALAMNDIQND